MANPSVTYTFTNGTTADGSQVSQNFTDLISGMTDGTKTFSIAALTVGGKTISNPMDSAGDMIIGGASGAIAKLDSGTDGYYLKAKGAAAPEWTQLEENGSFTATFTQAGGYSQAVTVKYARIGRTVTLKIPSFLATTTAAATIDAATCLPVSITPTTSTYVIIPCQHSTALVSSLFQITSTRNLILYYDLSANAFISGVATNGIPAVVSVTYSLD